MGKWHSIAAKKAAGDQAKAKNYSKVGKIIQLAAKNGSDPTINSALDLALQKAKYYNLPKDVIDKAIKKGSGQLKSDDLQEILYEGYGPGGVAILIKTLTDNTNRTSSNIKIILSKFGGNLGEPGSVSWQFDQKGVFVIDSNFEIIKDKGNDVEKLYSLNLDQAEMIIMDMEIDDIQKEGSSLVVTVDKNNFITISKKLRDNGFHIFDSGLHFLPENIISLSDIDKKNLQSLIQNLEQDEDVDSIYNNLD